MAKRYVEKLKEDKIQRLEWERQEELKKKKEKEERIKKEFERRMNPKTKEDFDLLYHALESMSLENTSHFIFSIWINENAIVECMKLSSTVYIHSWEKPSFSLLVI